MDEQSFVFKSTILGSAADESSCRVFLLGWRAMLVCELSLAITRIEFTAAAESNRMEVRDTLGKWQADGWHVRATRSSHPQFGHLSDARPNHVLATPADSLGSWTGQQRFEARGGGSRRPYAIRSGHRESRKRY